eukprot:c54293_g1_i1 orf=68-256(+)
MLRCLFANAHEQRVSDLGKNLAVFLGIRLYLVVHSDTALKITCRCSHAHMIYGFPSWIFSYP